MATTTNYSWTTPDDTSLVKDGAAAIRTLGSSIDTTTKNLNPQTTTGAIAYRSATSNVNTSLPIGTAGQVLKVNSGATAPEWVTATSGLGWTQAATGSLTGASVSITGLSGDEFIVYCSAWGHNSGTSQSLLVTFNNDTAANYNRGNSTNNLAKDNSIAITQTLGGTVNTNSVFLVTMAGSAEEIKLVLNPISGTSATGGSWENTAAITSIQLFPSSGSFDNGTYYVYKR